MPLSALVVGSGVIGLATARALAEAGARVVVLDAGGHGRDASRAAAGILGAGSEHDVDSPLFRLSVDALRAWPAAVEGLGRVSRRRIELRLEGTLLLSSAPSETTALAARAALHASAGLASRLLTPDAAHRLEPSLSPRIHAALHVPEGRLDNRALHAAYEDACRALGVEIRVGTAVGALLERAGRVTGVEIAAAPRAQRLDADAVVVAAGAWSDALATTTGVEIPSRPIKGQLVRILADDETLRHVVKRGLAYAVPRRGQGIVLGTTVEDAGFDRAPSADVARAVLAEVDALVPGLGAHAIAETWVGFRPRVADGLPVIGPVSARAGLHVVTGHHRNGILLAEITGRLAARAVFGDVDGRLAPFSPDRFAHGDRVGGGAPVRRDPAP